MSVYNVRLRKNGYQKYINKNCLKVPLAPPMGLHFKNYCIVVLLFNSEMFFVLFCSSVLLHSTDTKLQLSCMISVSFTTKTVTKIFHFSQIVCLEAKNKTLNCLHPYFRLLPFCLFVCFFATDSCLYLQLTSAEPRNVHHSSIMS